MERVICLMLHLEHGFFTRLPGLAPATYCVLASLYLVLVSGFGLPPFSITRVVFRDTPSTYPGGRASAFCSLLARGSTHRAFKLLHLRTFSSIEPIFRSSLSFVTFPILL